ncbi:hypothetical protein [Brevibacillus daliensis]|uniref:hypothetical protein n=1 Tax=Brevibacillus daliensis TaxID=2892995 RepID=UPI001E5C4637|nr:hypothetical protein [Brevibacillus daliensis]
MKGEFFFFNRQEFMKILICIGATKALSSPEAWGKAKFSYRESMGVLGRETRIKHGGTDKP